MRTSNGDSPAVLRGTGGRIYMAPSTFPMFPALALWSHNCRPPPPNVGFQEFVDWLLLPVHGVSRRG